MMQEALFAIRPEACARFRHAASSCTRCADVCPAGAVSFAVQAHIHARDCRQCGACAAVCPLEAITGGVDLQERKARSLAEVRDVRLQCQRAEGDFGDVDGTVSVHCLQSVSDTQIARALLAGVRRWVFVRNDCSRCERCNPKAGIDAVLRRIHTFAEELGVTVEVEIVQKASTVDFTRRAFWEKRLEEGYGTESQPPAMDLRYCFNPMRTESNKALPARFEALQKILSEQSSETVQRLADILVTKVPVAQGQGCTDCGWCVGVCPTGALQKDDEGLLCLANRCVGCGLCADLCLPKVLHLEPVVPETALETKRPLMRSVGSETERAQETVWEDRLKDILPDVPIYRT